MHIDGLAYDIGSSGDAIGQNPPSDVAQGDVAHLPLLHPERPDDSRARTTCAPAPATARPSAHGLFGVLVGRAAGIDVLERRRPGAPLESGWEATIIPGAGKPAFREYVQIYHEIGDEDFLISTKDGGERAAGRPDHDLATVPGSRAINYRSEPFMQPARRRIPNEKAHAYSSYTFGDPATPMMRGYLADPTKIRLIHGGGEMFHVFHLHGGGDRWRFNPVADKTYNYADTGLNKTPTRRPRRRTRLDSQAIGPGESYNLEIEGGAGGVQQAAGDFLYHCHIAKHYISGMWGFWRVYDTSQPDLVPLPDRVPPADRRSTPPA